MKINFGLNQATRIKNDLTNLVQSFLGKDADLFVRCVRYDKKQNADNGSEYYDYYFQIIIDDKIYNYASKTLTTEANTIALSIYSNWLLNNFSTDAKNNSSGHYYLSGQDFCLRSDSPLASNYAPNEPKSDNSNSKSSKATQESEEEIDQVISE